MIADTVKAFDPFRHIEIVATDALCISLFVSHDFRGRLAQRAKEGITAK